MTEFKIEQGSFDHMGVTFYGNDLNIAVENKYFKPLFLNIYDRHTHKQLKSIGFPENSYKGSIFAMRISNFDTEGLCYRLRIGNEEALDPYAKGLTGDDKFGKHDAFCLFRRSSDIHHVWKNSEPFYRWNDTVIYLLNVRGFTADSSSGVKNPGTFKGITEKTGYLKKLGITSLLLQPVYDFDEVMDTADSQKKKINYWGYTGGSYFAPKSAFSSEDPCEEFSEMVDALHGNGIEVLLQFYFDHSCRTQFIIDCLRYWVINYHIDGFEILGPRVPVRDIALEPIFAKTKILAFNPDTDDIYGRDVMPVFRNLASLNDSFMHDCRKYLKGDEDMLGRFTLDLLNNPEKCAAVNYIATYNSFTLYDLVSYERKHNESNGEDNKDGEDYNFSWNCGAEGRSRKKAIINLRKSQIKNALVFVLLAQGVPLIRAGDEFCNSQNGNNNAYCQDNKISWLNWKDYEKNKDIFDFASNLIAFRHQHPVFRSRYRKKMMDYISCGAPDVSFHGEQAWSPSFVNYNRHLAVMYSGGYEKLPDGKRDSDFYVAYNMHWQNHRFQIPNAPKGKRWKIIMTTAGGFFEQEAEIEDEEISVPMRSIAVLKSFDAPSSGNKK